MHNQPEVIYLFLLNCHIVKHIYIFFTYVLYLLVYKTYHIIACLSFQSIIFQVPLFPNGNK